MTTASDILAAQLATARTKAERRAAVQAFSNPESRESRTVLNAQLRAHLLNQLEGRAAGEASGAAGGYLAPPGFSATVIRLLKEYDGVLADLEDFPTPHGEVYKRPQVSSLVVSGAAQTENTAVSDGTSTLISFPGQQSWGITPTYAALLSTSMQLIQDALDMDVSTGNAGGWKNGATNSPADGYGPKPPTFSGVGIGNGDLVSLLASAAVESIGREVASVASTALYGAATTGQESTLTTLTSAKLAGLMGLVDPAYHRLGCAFYMNAVDLGVVFGGASGILANADGLHLFGYPVVVTNACTTYSSGTVSGPIFGNLSRFMTMRHVKDVGTTVLRERYADYFQVGITAYARVDFAVRGEPTAVAFSK